MERSVGGGLGGSVVFALSFLSCSSCLNIHPGAHRRIGLWPHSRHRYRSLKQSEANLLFRVTL